MAGELTTYFAPADARAIVLPGVPADDTYTVTIRAYRKVAADIDASGVILSPTLRTDPYKPVDVPAFNGDITGTIQGRGSLEVVQNLEAISSDGMLSTTEKPGIILQYNQLVAWWQSLDAKAATFTTYQSERDAASGAKTALDTYLNSLVPAWNDTKQHTPIDGATFTGKFAAFQASIADLNAAITGQSSDGTAGANGLNTARVILYQRSAIAPALPSANVTFTFSDGTVSGQGAWSVNIPAANGLPLWVTVATASSADAHDVIAPTEWAAAVILTKDGLNTASIFLYQRAAAAPAVPSATVTYTFATAALAGVNNNWVRSIPAPDGNPLYVTVASALNAADTDDIATGEWSAPVVLAQDGAAGSAGTPGLNSATVFLYQRSATAPAVPNADTTYTFATHAIAGSALGSWSSSVPAVNGQPLWITAAAPTGYAAAATVHTTDWAAPTVMAQDGAAGAAGAAGINSATVYLYKRSATVPARPTVQSTYTFATAALAGQDGGWTQAVPATNGSPLYVTIANALGTGSTDTIAASEWSVPAIMAQDGTAGAAGLHNAQVFLYQRASATPALPSAATTYTFTTGVLTGQNNGWTQAVPAANGQPLYVTLATASASTATDSIAASEWAAPIIMTQDGAAGAAGINSASVTLYQRSSSVPAKPNATTTYHFDTGVLDSITNGWSQTIPAANGYTLYAITAAALGATITDTIAATEWSTPAIIAIDTSDDTLSVVDKRSLIKFAADLEARYKDLAARATAQNLSLTAINAARTNWLGLLSSYSPVWNDTTQDTNIYSCAFGDNQMFPGGWTFNGTLTHVANGAYTTVTDSDTTVASEVVRNANLGGSHYTGAFVIAKDTITPTAVDPATGVSGRYVRLRLTSIGGTSNVASAGFDTSLGVLGGIINCENYGVLDLGGDATNGGEWLVFIQMAITADNTGCALRINPAAGNNTDLATSNAATVGSVNVRTSLITNSTWKRMGHLMLAGRLNAYVAAMTTLGKAISQLDGATSVVLDPINDVVIHADSTGAIKTGELPSSIYLTASMGTSNATGLGTWSLGTLSGGVQATIGAATGILKITAMPVTEAFIPVSFVYAGINRSATVHVVVQSDPAPASGGSTGTGGSTSGFPTSTSNLKNTNSGSYDLTYATACSDIISCVAGSGGNVAVNAPLSFKAVDGASTVNTYGKWRWRIAGGSASSFQDVVGEVACSAPAQNTLIDETRNIYKYMPGQLTVNQTKTGLTAGSVYEFIFVWRDDGTRAYKTTGTLSATGS